MNQVVFLAAAKDYFKSRGYAVIPMGADEFEARGVSGERCNVFVWEGDEVRISSAQFAPDLAELAGIFGGIGRKVPGGALANYWYFKLRFISA